MVLWIPLTREVTPASKLRHFKAAEESVPDCQRGATQLGQVLATHLWFYWPLQKGLSKVGRDPGFEIYRYGRQIACFRWMINILVDFFLCLYGWCLNYNGWKDNECQITESVLFNYGCGLGFFVCLFCVHVFFFLLLFFFFNYLRSEMIHY